MALASVLRPLLSAALALPLLIACGHPTPQAAVSANDAQCRSYGFETRSPRYRECRRLLDQRSALVASRPPGSGNPAGLPIYLPPPELPAPQERGCLAVVIQAQSYTNCP